MLWGWSTHRKKLCMLSTHQQPHRSDPLPQPQHLPPTADQLFSGGQEELGGGGAGAERGGGTLGRVLNGAGRGGWQGIGEKSGVGAGLGRELGSSTHGEMRNSAPLQNSPPLLPIARVPPTFLPPHKCRAPCTILQAEMSK